VTARGLVFVSGSKKGTALGEEVFAPRERKRYVVSLLGLKLGNEDAGIELQTNAGQTLSVLHWGKAQEAAVYRYSSFATALVGNVLRVIDGDTFQVVLENDDSRTEDVRLLGVDAPETVHPTKGIQPFGIEASNYTKALIENKKVELQFDSQERDLYGRALAYAYVLPSHESVQEMMIREGLVKVDEQHLYTKKDEYLAMQEDAKNRGVGMWAQTSKKTPSKKKSGSSASSKSSKSSAKKSVSVVSTRTVAAANPYESKPVYQNVFSSAEQGGEFDEVASSSSDDDLYASLLQDQPEIAENLSPKTPSGISVPMLMVILFGNTVLILSLIAGGVFLGFRLRILKV
jgi:endonuclease YncB( thermonuclease family)